MTDVIRELSIEMEVARSLLANLRDVIADDEQAMADAVEGETNLREAIARAVERLGDIEAYTEAISARQKDLAERKSRLDRQGAMIRAALASAIASVDWKRVELPEATLTLKAGPPSVIVTEEADIPADFWKSQPPKLDRKSLFDALKERAVPGATLSNGGTSLQIRRS